MDGVSTCLRIYTICGIAPRDFERWYLKFRGEVHIDNLKVIIGLKPFSSLNKGGGFSFRKFSQMDLAPKMKKEKRNHVLRMVDVHLSSEFQFSTLKRRAKKTALYPNSRTSLHAASIWRRRLTVHKSTADKQASLMAVAPGTA